MSKRNAPIRTSTAYLHVGQAGEISVDVAARRFVSVDIDGAEPIELNAHEAKRLGRALIKAGRQVNG